MTNVEIEVIIHWTKGSWLRFNDWQLASWFKLFPISSLLPPPPPQTKLRKDHVLHVFSLLTGDLPSEGQTLQNMVNQQALHILLKCILVLQCVCMKRLMELKALCETDHKKLNNIDLYTLYEWSLLLMVSLYDFGEKGTRLPWPL